MKYRTELGVLCNSILEMLESEHWAANARTIYDYQYSFAKFVSIFPEFNFVDLNDEDSFPILVSYSKVECQDDVTKGGTTKLFDDAIGEPFLANIDEIATARVRVQSPYSRNQRSIPLVEIKLDRLTPNTEAYPVSFDWRCDLRMWSYHGTGVKADSSAKQFSEDQKVG